MLQFPRFNFSPRRGQTSSQRNLFQNLRSALAMGLAALLILTFLSFSNTAFAQQSGSGSKVPDGDYFMIYQAANGDTVCRTATMAERLEMSRTSTQNLGLHQITHAKRELSTNAQGGDNGTGGLTIILVATNQLEGFPDAKAAFIRAAATWEAQIKSPITIYLRADYGTTNFGSTWGSGILGSTSSPSFSAPYQTVRNSLINGASTSAETSLYASLPASTLPTDNGDASTISVSSSIGRALGLLNATALPPNANNTQTSTSDIAASIGFNSNFTYDFDPSDGIDSGKTDFEAVATHEIGHALGFTSRAGGNGNSSPAIWDIFRFRTGATLATFSTAQRVMAMNTASGPTLQYYFDGNPELGLSTGGPSGSDANGDGNQSSHWKQRSLNNNVYIGIMDPRIPSGTRRVITANDTIALNYFGYNLDNSNPPPPPPPPPAAPANDNFASAQSISGCTGSVTGTNISATHESGEPSHDSANPPNAGSGSVWYRWQAIVSGSVTITTVGSDYDTMLGVYTGTAVNTLTPIAKNDDINTQEGNVQSSVTFNATAGTTYKIAVDGWGSEMGNIKLNWTASNCQQATTVQLSASSYTAGEGAGHATATVTRSDSTTAASVNYTTSDTAGLTDCNVFNGVASSRCDYATSIGTLSFAVGESSKDIFIPVADDAYAEGPESFTLTLSNPTGASLGTISSATITITDNDSVTGINPVDGAPFFVRQQYIDFLGREPDPAGLQGWQDVLRNCGTTVAPPCDRIEVSAGFFRSPEFQDRGYFIYRFYSTVGKIPLYSDFMPDFAKVSGFLSAQQLEDNKVAFVNEFMTRSDFQTRYGGITDPTAYVNALLNTVGVTPPASAKQAWITGLSNSSMTRAQVLRSVAESTEVYNKYYNEAFVIMQYFGYLRRSADISYLNWIQTMNQSGDYRTMINGFLNSPEYRKRFGP